MPTTILQLTDCHLFADPGGRLKEVATAETLRKVLALVRSEFADAARIVFTGDLAHDDLADTYLMLREMLGDLVDRSRFIPGNHDDRAGLREVFGDRIPGGSGPVTFRDELDGWCLIGLDTQDTGHLHGRIEPQQLAWLQGALSAAPEHPAVVFLHHPPVPVGSPWLDEIRLQQPDALQAVIAAAPQVRALFTGHIHQRFEGRFAHVQVHSTPSTGVQFRPATEELQLDTVPPGLRVIALDDGAFTTRVVRVANG